MSLLGDVLKTIKEAVEEAQAQAQGKPVRPGSLPRPHQAAREAEQAAQETQQRILSQAKKRAAEPTADQKRRQKTLAEEAARREHQAAVRSQPLPSGDPRRIAALMRQPNSLRELVILKELLDRPVALRHLNRRQPWH